MVTLGPRPTPAPTLDDLRANLELVNTLPAGLVADLYRQAASVEAALRARLLQGGATNQQEAATGTDRALDVSEAAAMLNTSKDTLYSKWKNLPFAFKDSLDGKLKFSRRRIEQYIADRVR